MAVVRAFKAVRPAAALAGKVAALPYDVMNSEEAREMVKDQPFSFIHIDKAEVDLPEGTDIYSDAVYAKAKENFERMIQQGVFEQDLLPNLYIYRLTMNGRSQTGLVCCASVDEYLDGTIKRHELTRADKEADRIRHVDTLNANTGPIFLAYKENPDAKAIIDGWTSAVAPVYDFVSEDGIGHTVWMIDSDTEIGILVQSFLYTENLYIADGHHRSAAAALVGAEKAQQNPNHKGDEEYNYFMAVCFPANQLTIIDYNRVVKDLNGLTPAEFLAAVEKNFIVEEKGEDIYKPNALHNFSLYLDGKWYSLTAKEGTYDDNDPIGVLDVTISSNLILDEILGIKDLRSDKRIDFVGGIRGLGELKKRVDSGEMKVALALYPVSMKQLMDIADTGNIMPPKTTWFEPKLRSGLIIHKLV